MRRFRTTGTRRRRSRGNGGALPLVRASLTSHASDIEFSEGARKHPGRPARVRKENSNEEQRDQVGISSYFRWVNPDGVMCEALPR